MLHYDHCLYGHLGCYKRSTKFLERVFVQMNIAYLILAHQHPLALKKLIDKLSMGCAHFFVHIDKKKDIKEFQSVVTNVNVVFLKGRERVKVSWGGFSQVAATLNLIQAAKKHYKIFDRYCLLSGSCYPIKNNEEIRTRLASNIEYIRIDNIINGSNGDIHFDNITYYWFMDWPSIIKNALKRKVKRNAYTGFDSYYGSQWWCLTRDCIDYVMMFVNNNIDYMKFHKYTLCADEIFFASIIKNSPFANNISHDFEKAKDLVQYKKSNIHGCHYINWNAVGCSLPKVLDMEDAEFLVKSDALFARKFDPEKSRELIDFIDSVK